MQDYNVAVTDDRHRETVRFWRQQMASVNGGFRWEVNEAAARDRDAVQSFFLSQRASDLLNRFASDDVGRFAIVTAAIAYVLSRYFQQTPIILKTPALAFTSTSSTPAHIPIIIDVQEEWSVGKYLRESGSVIEATYSFDGFPLMAFLEGDYRLNANRMTNVAIRDERLHGATPPSSDEDILIQLNQAGTDAVQIRYRADRVESFLICGFSRHLVRALEQFENVHRKLAEIELLADDERTQITLAFNSTAIERAPETVVSLFESQVERAPDATALIFRDDVLSYRGLNGRANQLARYLAETFDNSASPIVGVMAHRSPELIIAILGVLKARASYVPIDPEYPADRISYILDDAGISLLLTQSDYLLELQDFAGQIFALDLQLGSLTASGENLDEKPQPQDSAYVIYTSGSTGNPKGCQVEHGNLSNYLRWATHYYFEDESSGHFGLYSSLSFDFTITNIYCPLLRGKSLFIYDHSQAIHHILAHAFGAQTTIDVMKLTPSHIRLLEELEISGTNIKKVIAGGEELRPAHVQTLRRINPAMQIYNEYGPTEATVGCIVKHIAAGETEILIGKPIENAFVYILDKRRRLVPTGVRGEICIAGEGVGRGYHRRADLTAEKFFANPFAKGRLYKTGDLGRWLPDGNIQCFGRTDDQVKIRGNRIELGEIEHLLTRHQDVRQAVVLAREDYPGEKQLVAYVAGGPSLNAAMLREFVAARLPQYMSPSFFVLLESLPLTPNGKVDKKALPAPESFAENIDDSFAAPTTVDEEELLRIWQEILHRERLSIRDNFFEMGGDSLTAVQLISRVWERLGIDIQIDDVFEAPTIAALAARIRDAGERTRGEEMPPLVPVSRSEPIPLSFAQQRLWFLAHLEGRTATYNVAHALLLEGALDVPALDKSLKAIIARHEVLRTNLVERDGWPYQVISEDHEFVLESITLAAGDADCQIREAQQLADARAASPFDLSRDLLLRASLLRLNSRSHVLIVVMHHIVWDAWSAEIFNRELAELYRAFTAGVPQVLPPLPIQYADFAYWQRNTLVPYIKDKHLAYWIEKLSGAPPLLELRTDRPRPALQSYEGAKEGFEFGDDLTEALGAVARRNGATMFMTFLTAYAVVLYRHSTQSDMVIGSPAASRTRREIEPLIGFFVNMLGLRIDLADDPTLSELLHRIKRTAIEAYQYQDTPFDLIVEALQPGRSLSHNPIFQVSIALQEDQVERTKAPDLRVMPIEVPGARARFDMELAIERADTKLVASIVYNRDLFDPATIIEMRDHFIGTLRAMVANPDQRLSDLSLLNETEWQALIGRMKEMRAQKSASSLNLRPERRGYVAPRNAIEESLARIWADVLRHTHVGIYDNFFELGGDSILSIQVISRAGKIGLGLTTQQIFQHQTIAELATVAGGKAIEAEQGLVVGAIPLTPIQRWFFEHAADPRLHFNQSLLLETPPDFQIDALRAAVNRLPLHHDMLRLRIDLDASGWIQMVPGEFAPLQVDAIDLSDFPDDLRAQALEECADGLQAGLDLMKTPLIRAAYFDFGPGQAGRLLLIVHHLIIDGVSWRILIEDLLALYEQLLQGAEASLPLKTTSFKEWSLRIQSLAKSPEIAEEARYWAALADVRIKPLPLDGPSDEAANTVADAETYKFCLNALDTRCLLEGAPRHYGSQANEVLVASLVMALNAWTRADALLIDLEGHGREELFETVDLSRTVGWFTTLFPVIFDTFSEAAPAGILSQVKERLRAIPHRGLGYGLLRYCSERPDIQSQLSAGPQAQLVFNYLGQTDHVQSSHKGFRLAAESSGADESPQRKRAHLFEINAIVSGGELQIDWIYSRKLHRKDTVARLAESFREALASLLASCSPLPAALLRGLPELAPQAIADAYALSPLQSGMLFRSVFEPESSAYFEQLSCEIEGPLDIELFRRAWLAVVERHDVMRSAFFWEGLEQPLQVVFRSVELPWEFCDWHEVEPGEQDERFEKFLEHDRHRKFDLQKAPAFRLALMRFTADRHGFLWSHHHILLDGWSVANILQEVMAYYRAQGRCRFPQVKPFRSYIDWLQNQNPAEAESFWRDNLRGFIHPTPLPASREPSFVNRYDKQEASFSEAMSDRLRAVAQQKHITLNTLMRGVWAILLNRYSNEADVCFGVTLAGRPAALAGVEEMVGLFINTLPLRVSVPETTPLSSWLKDLQNRHADLEKFSHSDLADVQRWAQIPTSVRLFESILVFENYPVDQSLDHEIETLKFNRARAFEQSEYPLTLAVVPARELYVRLRYDAGRFDAPAIRRILSHLQTVLECVAANPDQAIVGLEILSDSERQQLNAWNDTAAPAALPATLHQMWERQAEQTPEATALVCGDLAITFQQLNEQSSRLANLLVARGVVADMPVALLFERSVEMIVAIFGVLKAGGAYLPLDVTCPRERLRFMLDDSKACLVLTQERLLSRLPDCGIPFVCLDRDRAEIGRQASTNSPGCIHSSNLAYIIYTSGTSGRPKGVAIAQQSVVNLLHGLNRTVYADDPGKSLRVGINGPLAFDTSVKQIFQLLNGHCLVIIPEAIRSDPAALIGFARQTSMDVLDCTPSHLELLLENGLLADSGSLAVGKVLVGGESISGETWTRLASYPAIDFYNVYGPTETTVDATVARIINDCAGPVIGGPLDHVGVYSLDSNLRRVPTDIAGELFVGGAGVARGYLNDAVASAASFLPDPFGSEAGARIYKTGDLVRWRADGRLAFIGRRDEQIKIRGFRIEPREIEMLLEQHPAVVKAVVIARQDQPANHQLVAYTVLRSGVSLESNELLSFLKNHLPDYMIPAACIQIDQVPLTPNAKIDKRALPAPFAESPTSSSQFVPPRDSFERQLVDIWNQTLGLNENNILSDFFELGGHSILAMKLVGRIQAEFRRSLPLTQLFENPTIERLAATLRDQQAVIEWPSLVQMHRGGQATPIFLLPGAGGNILYYYGLARCLGQNRPVYGLQAIGLDGVTPPLTSIAEIARHNIEKLREAQPLGPYLLAGHSFGGKVAFEMSQQLRAAGFEVGLVAIFDTPAPIFERAADRRDWDDSRWLVQIVREIEEFLHIDLAVSYDELCSLPEPQQMDYVMERIEQTGWWVPGSERTQLRGHLQVYKVNYQIDYNIREPAHKVPIMLFKASDEDDSTNHPSLQAVRQEPSWGWAGFSSAPVKVIEISGDHLTMMSDLNAAIIAEHLTAYLNRS